MNTILEVNQVYKYFGGVKANENISLNVEQGSIVGLIGPNGSGKTTLFNSIVGTYPIDNGSIKFEGKELSELPVPVVAKLGLLRTFQQTRIYGKKQEYKDPTPVEDLFTREFTLTFKMADAFLNYWIFVDNSLQNQMKRFTSGCSAHSRPFFSTKVL